MCYCLTEDASGGFVTNYGFYKIGYCFYEAIYGSFEANYCFYEAIYGSYEANYCPYEANYGSYEGKDVIKYALYCLN